MKQAVITAHSGCEGTPDNSLASIEKGITLGAEALNAPYKYTPDELIGRMRSEHTALSLWTLNDEKVLMEYMRKDLLNITTRAVSLALSIKKEVKNSIQVCRVRFPL